MVPTVKGESKNNFIYMTQEKILPVQGKEIPYYDPSKDEDQRRGQVDRLSIVRTILGQIGEQIVDSVSGVVFSFFRADVQRKEPQLKLRKGLCNPGTYCFQSSVLQALFSLGECQFKDSDFGKKLQTLRADLWSGGPALPKKRSREIFEQLQKYGYQRPGSGGDPMDVYEIIQNHLVLPPKWKKKGKECHASHSFLIRNLIDKSLEEVLQKEISIEKESCPTFFVIFIHGRMGKERNETEVSLSMDLSLLPGGRAKYRLASAVQYDPNAWHYYALEPVYRDNGKKDRWIKYDDSEVAVVKRNLLPDIRKNGYMFVYKHL